MILLSVHIKKKKETQLLLKITLVSQAFPVSETACGVTYKKKILRQA